MIKNTTQSRTSTKQVLLFITLLLIIGVTSYGQDTLYTDNFTRGISNWVVESESDSSKITYQNEALDIISPKGQTLWYHEPLRGNIKISYEAFVVNNGGKYDRVSDLNCFWMASDPGNPGNFFKQSGWRKGTFGKYYSLALYYVGYGGNNNTTTRLRKYKGDYQSVINEAKRPGIIKEYSDPVHLITPNRWNTIQIIVNQGNVKYVFNNELLFDYNDSDPYREGYFGFRTTNSHIKIRNFIVIKI